MREVGLKWALGVEGSEGARAEEGQRGGGVSWQQLIWTLGWEGSRGAVALWWWCGLGLGVVRGACYTKQSDALGDNGMGKKTSKDR